MIKKNIVLSLFDLSGIFVQPWADAGYECHIVDIQHPAGVTKHNDNIYKWGMDVKEFAKQFADKYPEKLDNVCFAAFFPPCTDLAVSGARWFKDKEKKNPGTRERAMDLVYWSHEFGESLKCPYFIENPVSVISSEWRKPDFSFDPFEYGGYDNGEEDGYTKRTCLWTSKTFTLPIKKKIKLDAKKKNFIWNMAPSADRQNKRSVTPRGFAQAIYETYSK